MQIKIQAENFDLTSELEDYVKLHLGFDDSGAYDRVNDVLVRLSEVDRNGKTRLGLCRRDFFVGK